MKERPILFSAPMVRAILEGRKTQTRRLVVPRTAADRDVFSQLAPDERMLANGGDGSCLHGACDYLARRWGEPGDRLWVRETWQPIWAEVDPKSAPSLTSPEGWAIGYPATDGRQEFLDADRGFTNRCKPGIHMPRWASRINLRVTSVRVERLQAITEDDAIAEGVRVVDPNEPFEWTHRDEFARLWDNINGKRAPFCESPWVWVVGFERMETEG